VQILDAIDVKGGSARRIELWSGDLTTLRPEDAIDLLVVSAFPNDYTETADSLIGALGSAGIHVATLAAAKDIDVRPTHACWLSGEIPPGATPSIKRVLCFEPLVRGDPPEVVGDIFRVLTPLLELRSGMRSLAMPIVAAGDQHRTTAEMLRPILDAAIHWLELGLALDRIVIAAHSAGQADEAAEIFAGVKRSYVAPLIKPDDTFSYDVFVSYSHKNASAANTFVSALKSIDPQTRVFVDRQELKFGAAWQLRIFKSIEKSRVVVSLLSDEYAASKPCEEEFSLAWQHGDKVGRDLLCPVYVRSGDLPTFMTYRQYIDAREEDETLLQAAAEEVLARARSLV
jgi:hypothetical protein